VKLPMLVSTCATTIAATNLPLPGTGRNVPAIPAGAVIGSLAHEQLAGAQPAVCHRR
jgi:hypothetical protein